MVDVSKRIAMLEKMVGAGQADSFAYYALGMEYRREGRIEDALSTFRTLRERDAGYLPLYLMAGQLLIDNARKDEALEWLNAGIELARNRGDMKTLGELESALASC